MLRLRRSELSTPASNEKMMAKAAASDADLVFLDLEDSVAPSEKVAARQKAVAALRSLDWGSKTTAVRINDLSTQWAYGDIIDIVEAAGDRLDILIVPKVLSGRDVWWVDVLLTQIETRLQLPRRIGLEVLIEEVEAMIHVEDIARSSPRLEALIFGPGDYSASQGVDIRAVNGRTDYPADIWHYARNKIVIAARAAGIDAVDGPFAAFNDPKGYVTECGRSAALGFVGKWAIHPSQIPLANDAYSPAPEDVERARRLTEAYEDAQAHGLGAVTVDGEMVDAASVRIVANMLRQADLIAER